MKGLSHMSNAADARQQLAPTGTLRAIINCANTILTQRSPQTGELSGLTVELAREIARRLRGPGLRWRGSSPVLSAIKADLARHQAKATTPTEPAPKGGAR